MDKNEEQVICENTSHSNDGGAYEDAGPGDGSDLPVQFYGLLTQIMLYVKTMDDDYKLYRGKECD